MKKSALPLSLLFLGCLLINYFLFLNTSVKDYFSIQSSLNKLLETLEQEKYIQQQDKIIQKKLAQFSLQQNLYALATTDNPSNVYTDYLVSLSRTNGFSIVHAAATQKEDTLQFSLSVIGNYFSLLQLLIALKKSDYPLYLSNVTITQKQNLHLDFSTKLPLS